MLWLRCFNPRTHTGCDGSPLRSTATILVSIHAPTRGATYTQHGGCSVLHGFNPRTHTGCDLCRTSFSTSLPLFQSTHPHGVRRRFGWNINQSGVFQSTHPHGVRPAQFTNNLKFRYCFNPRTHTGCDSHVKHSRLVRCRFQSTHPHGVRQYKVMDYKNSIQVSIHAPTRGATARY